MTCSPHSSLLQDHWQTAADHLVQQFKQLLQRQQQQQQCVEALNAGSAASPLYQPEQLQQAEQLWHDLQVRSTSQNRAVQLVSAFSACQDCSMRYVFHNALCIRACLTGTLSQESTIMLISTCERTDNYMSRGWYNVAQGHLLSLVDLRQLVDGVIGNDGHPHSIDGKKLGQAVSSSNAGSPAPDCGVDIMLLLQVLTLA